MKHVKSLVKGALWEAFGFAMILAAAWLFVDTKQDAFILALIWPIARIVTWYPYERLFKSAWRRFETWFNRKEMENADTKTP